MSNEENYIIENETTDITKKQEYWSTGIGLNKVDNLEPSKYLLDLSKKNINGELKYYEVETLLKNYYETQDINNINIQKEKECDLVSLRIAQLLEDKSFGFSPISLLTLNPILLRYFSINTAVVLVFPSPKGCTCQMLEVNLAICFINSSLFSFE